MILSFFFFLCYLVLADVGINVLLISWKILEALLFSHSVMSDSLRPHGLQHTRLPSPLPPLRACSTHAHWVSDVIQTSHTLSTHSPPALNLSQDKGLYQWVSSSGGRNIGVSASASVLPVNIHYQFPLGLTVFSSVFSNTTAQKHHFFSTHPSLWVNTHIHTWLLEKKKNIA